MTIAIDWICNARLASLHWAFCANCFNQDLPANLLENCQGWQQLSLISQKMECSPERFWEQLFQLSLDSGSHRDLAQRLLARCLPPASRTDFQLAQMDDALRLTQSEFSGIWPKFAEEIQLRQRPLQEQWEAYGPGLICEMGELLNPELFPQHAQVCLVAPVVGGFGWAHLATNRCHIEAVLTNSHPQITEPMRLAWLVSQLEFERPVYSELINMGRLRKVAALATLPPVIFAAEVLGLSSFNSQMLLQAIRLWRIETELNYSQALAEVLMVWWDTLRSGQVEWSTALTALDRMVQ